MRTLAFASVPFLLAVFPAHAVASSVPDLLCTRAHWRGYRKQLVVTVKFFGKHENAQASVGAVPEGSREALVLMQPLDVRYQTERAGKRSIRATIFEEDGSRQSETDGEDNTRFSLTFDFDPAEPEEMLGRLNGTLDDGTRLDRDTLMSCVFTQGIPGELQPE